MLGWDEKFFNTKFNDAYTSITARPVDAEGEMLIELVWQMPALSEIGAK